MNKYLEKIASWKNPMKFVGYVTGKRKASAAARLTHVSDFMQESHKVGPAQALKNISDRANSEASHTRKARIAAGIGAAGLAGGTAYGYKKIRNKQDRELAEQYNILFNKQASTVGAAKEVGKGISSALGRTLKRVGSATVDTMNTAGGGKIKDYAHVHGINVGTKRFDEFKGGNIGKQLSVLRAHQGIAHPGDARMKAHKFNLRTLHTGKRNARIALAGTAGTAISAYGWKKARDAQKKEQKYY